VSWDWVADGVLLCELDGVEFGRLALGLGLCWAKAATLRRVRPLRSANLRE
jgi:hypothetical protein